MGGKQDQEAALVDELPSALGPGLEEALQGRRPALFLDYDGTLTPIVDHPDDALLSDSMRRALVRLASVHPVAVVSGRDRADVEGKVGVEGIYYAGSHGFDISGPDGFREERGSDYRPILEEAADELEAKLEGIEGAWVERKRYAIAAHFRRAPAEAEGRIEALVGEVAARHPNLRSTGGKKILELRPDLDWDKGRAVLWMLDVLGWQAFLPVYVGDDETDEDAFRVLDDGTGLGVVVDISHRPTRATLSLADSQEVAAFLERLAGWEG